MGQTCRPLWHSRHQSSMQPEDALCLSVSIGLLLSASHNLPLTVGHLLITSHIEIELTNSKLNSFSREQTDRVAAASIPSTTCAVSPQSALQMCRSDQIVTIDNACLCLAQDWCSGTNVGDDSEGELSSGVQEFPIPSECASFSFLPPPGDWSAPLEAPVKTPVMVMGTLPLTPGGGISSPAARLLLSDMRPGWALDPVAGISTPYVQQLLRTLPVLTPETGACTLSLPSAQCPAYSPMQGRTGLLLQDCVIQIRRLQIAA